ncbi:hypothetical protein IWZ03DRAFT_202012 [Phyllosticta citriasiana]|uniref:Uncharacterized protein n=1 Tax=Phyllosticta citriasiana TaxID=595635 RepID=A0ABR1KKF4_9PEZI
MQSYPTVTSIKSNLLLFIKLHCRLTSCPPLTHSLVPHKYVRPWPHGEGPFRYGTWGRAFVFFFFFFLWARVHRSHVRANCSPSSQPWRQQYGVRGCWYGDSACVLLTVDVARATCSVARALLRSDVSAQRRCMDRMDDGGLVVDGKGTTGLVVIACA